ncbi:MAG TPA: ATP-binding protein [Chromatiales bacterium]|nr:ATP-binding protein [Chromatiales bacterium]
MSNLYRRPQAAVLERRLREPRRFIQVIAGPRQVGKTTLVRQVTAALGLPTVHASADEPTLRGPGWLAQQWEAARHAAARHGTAVLALDEVQKVQGWAERVKRLWDEDSAAGRDVRVVLLGSAPLLVRHGLTESLAGRFETIRLPHWSYREMREAFGFTLEAYLHFGGYPGAAALAQEPDRWARYVRDALIETTVARDILLLEPVRKPALLRRLFELCCRHSGQILSFNKMLGQLQDAGNTTTLAHYLDLLEAAGMAAGLQKHAGHHARRRASSPKLQVYNTALMTATLDLRPEDVARDPALRGRLVESAVGAHLLNGALETGFAVRYWRERGREVDFVLEHRGRLLAIEVKAGLAAGARSGIDAFLDLHPDARPLLVGGEGIPLEDFLLEPPTRWLEA